MYGHLKLNLFGAFILFLVYTCACQAQDEAGQALDDARRLASQGDYEGALAKHIWFHDHALSIRPSYYGVRLSFALGDWIDLGKKYPKALEVLKDIRDKKTSKLQNGTADRDLFHDVTAINEYLHENKSTVTLFKQIDTANPDFAHTISSIVEPALVQEKEFVLARKHLGDPSKRLATGQQHYQEMIKWANTTDHPDNMRQAFEYIFSNDVIRLITILKETGDKETAKEIQTNALKTLDDENIRNAL